MANIVESSILEDVKRKDDEITRLETICGVLREALAQEREENARLRRLTQIFAAAAEPFTKHRIERLDDEPDSAKIAHTPYTLGNMRSIMDAYLRAQRCLRGDDPFPEPSPPAVVFEGQADD